MLTEGSEILKILDVSYAFQQVLTQVFFLFDRIKPVENGVLEVELNQSHLKIGFGEKYMDCKLTRWALFIEEERINFMLTNY